MNLVHVAAAGAIGMVVAAALVPSPTVFGAVLIAICGAVAVAIGRHLSATEKTGRRICRMIDACELGELFAFRQESVYDEIHRAYWFGQEPRLSGLDAALWARTAPERAL